MSPFILTLISTMLVLNQAFLSKGQPLGVEDYYNIIEPKDPRMMTLREKPRGKLNMKNLILSMNQLDAKQKYWGKNIEEDLPLEASSTTTTTTTLNPSTTERKVYLERQSSAQYTHDYNPPRLANLHEQSEVEQKRFFHSAIDGWMF